jgi:hypothetical protein
MILEFLHLGADPGILQVLQGEFVQVESLGNNLQFLESRLGKVDPDGLVRILCMLEGGAGIEVCSEA